MCLLQIQLANHVLEFQANCVLQYHASSDDTKPVSHCNVLTTVSVTQDGLLLVLYKTVLLILFFTRSFEFHVDCHCKGFFLLHYTACFRRTYLGLSYITKFFSPTLYRCFRRASVGLNYIAKFSPTLYKVFQENLPWLKLHNHIFFTYIIQVFQENLRWLELHSQIFSYIIQGVSGEPTLA